MTRAGLLFVVTVSGCGTITPVNTAAVPPPWPKPGPSAVQRTAPVEPTREPEGKPPVPPLKNDAIPNAPVPPRSL
jgi:hypothetical protein